eukprot:365938-Chlamydomonas_euryale.AAC.13
MAFLTSKAVQNKHTRSNQAHSHAMPAQAIMHSDTLLFKACAGNHALPIVHVRMRQGQAPMQAASSAGVG